MKKTYVFALILLFIGSSISAQKKQQLALNNPKANAIVWENKDIKLGNTVKNQSLNVEFTCQNNSKGPLVITSVRPSCGCTGVNYPKQALAPGEKATITASYKPASEGYYKKTLKVYTNLTTEPVILSLSGTVK